MPRSSQARWLYALSIAFAALPFAFGMVRAIRTGHDVRYVWVALGSLLGAAAVWVAGKRFSKALSVAVSLSALAFVGATLSGITVAVLLGTRLGPGLLIVASSFGLCCAAGGLLHALAGLLDDLRSTDPSSR